MSRYLRHGSYWTKEEIQNLKNELLDKYSPDVIANRHNRSLFAIKSYVVLHMIDDSNYNKYIRYLDVTHADITKLINLQKRDLDTVKNTNNILNRLTVLNKLARKLE